MLHADGDYAWYAMLLGFSKLGFGAVTILLRYLNTIGKAAAWDAPLSIPSLSPQEFEMQRVFVTQENYDAYFIPDLIDRHAAILKRGEARLTLVSNGRDTGSIPEVHHQLDALGIAHHYAIDEQRAQTWTSGWLPVAVGESSGFHEEPRRMLHLML